MIRSMEEISEKTAKKIPQEYKMSFEEEQRLYEMIIAGKWFHAISMAYQYGFAMGCRATRKKDVDRI